MTVEEQKKFENWLQQFIVESGHAFGMGFFIQLENGTTLYNGTAEYKEWYDNKLVEYEKMTENKKEISEIFLDWNILTLDQMVEYLRNKYRFSSSGDAKCIYHLIEFYDKHKNVSN